MHLLGHSAGDAKQHKGPDLRPEPPARGAWYEDPFGKADERWWDGTKWTQDVREAPGQDEVPEVREIPDHETSETQLPTVHIDGSADAAGARQPVEETDGCLDASDDPPPVEETDEGARFPVTFQSVAGKHLRVVPPDRSRLIDFELLAGAGRVGSFSLGWTELARMNSAEGSWRLKKRRGVGWAFIIESSHGRHVGWYSGRRWVDGGMISLVDGTQAELRKSVNRSWRLQSTAGENPFLEIRGSHIPRSLTMICTIRSLPPEITDMPVLVLTACTVAMLERMVSPTRNPAG